MKVGIRQPCTYHRPHELERIKKGSSAHLVGVQWKADLGLPLVVVEAACRPIIATSCSWKWRLQSPSVAVHSSVYHRVLLLPKGMVARSFFCVYRVDGVSVACCSHSCRCAAKMLSGLQALWVPRTLSWTRCTGRMRSSLNAAAVYRRSKPPYPLRCVRVCIKLGYVRVFVHLPVRPCQALQYME